MENLSHTLSGLVLARLGIDRDGGVATALVVAAANFPDVDGLSLFVGQGAFLRHHHGITHSVLGVLVAGPILAAVFAAVARWRGGHPHFGRFLLYAYAGLTMHCALDSLLSYGMRPWLPWDGRWYYGDVIHVADPWMWVILGSGAILGGPKTGAGRWWWLVTTTLTVGAAALAVSFGRAPWGAVPVLAACWLVVLALRFWGFAAGRRRSMALVSLVVAAGYVAVLIGCGQRNRTLGLRALRAQVGLAPTAIEGVTVQPRACVPWASTLIVQTADRLYQVRVAGSADSIGIASPLPRRLHELQQLPGVAAEAVAVWQLFARHPFIGRLGTDWILGDARYSFVAQQAWCNLRVPGGGR